MRAAVLEEDRFGVRDWPDPRPGPGDVLVALTRVGICGSDVHFAIERSVRPSFVPIVLGHEPAGRVLEVGPDVDEALIGRRVAVIAMVACHRCDLCRSGRARLCRRREVLGADRHGCWAEFVSVPERNVLPIPDGLPDDVAAVATDAVATALHAVRTRGAVGPGARVAIWGAGGLGSCAVAIARTLGAARIDVVDVRPAGARAGAGPRGRRRLASRRGGRRSRHGRRRPGVRRALGERGGGDPVAGPRRPGRRSRDRRGALLLRRPYGLRDERA